MDWIGGCFEPSCGHICSRLVDADKRHFHAWQRSPFHGTLSKMNSNNITSLIRSILLALGAGLVAQGKLTDGSLQEIVGGILALGSVLWSQLYHSKNPPAP